ncbi:MAG: rRNA pseudouridine synthase [Actinomycetota bacterium]|nr:MAG: rRNA pseudouridine synthase [Actinomycetota bacterium]
MGESASSPSEGLYATEKLQKVLARIGYGSRRSCEVMIARGRVEVNGQVAQVGTRVNVNIDLVKVDGQVVGVRPDLVYIILNKPPGFVSSVSDPQGRPTVLDLVPSTTRIFPVGRLDIDSEGLIILTNDGDLTNLVTHPSHGVEKEYLVQLDRSISEKAVTHLRHGVMLEDGRTAPAKATKLSETLIRVTIHEGRNRQVRRMCDVLGYKVVRLARTRIGPIRDGKLKQGEWRLLKVEEIAALHSDLTRTLPGKASITPQGS